LTVKNQYPFNCKVASKTRCNVLKRCSSLKGSQQVGQTKTFLNRLHVLFLVLLLVACEQQTPSNSTLQPTLMPTAAVLAENRGSDDEVSNLSVSPVTSNTVTIENTSVTPTVEPSFIPVIQQTPIPVATPLPPITFADDGSHILILEEWHDDIPPALYAMKPDGTNWVVVASELGYGTRLLDSSPDGSWALLAHGEKGTYTLKLDASQEERLLDSGFASSGAWSPDGQHVLLVIDEALMLADISSGQVTPIPLPLASNMPEVLTTDMGFYPVASHIEGISWSPDSSWFAFQQSGLTAEEQQAGGLYRYTLATGTVETLYLDEHHRYRTRFYLDYNLQAFPLVSPNGETILTDLGTYHGLASVPTTGGELTPMVAGLGMAGGRLCR
jgi:WD40 repeat protein